MAPDASPVFDAKVFGRNLVTAACAGALGTTCIFPIDMVKTRLIEQIGLPQRLYSGPIDCFRKIVARDGFKGLYKGLKVNFIGVMPEKAIKLAVNDACRNHFTQANNGAPVTIPQGVVSGGVAGLTQCIATNPMEVTKMFYQVFRFAAAIILACLTRVQTWSIKHPNTPAPSISDAVKLHLGGAPGLYRGVCSTLLRDIPFSMMFFSMHGVIQEHFRKADGFIPFQYTMLSGLVSGGTAAYLSTPFDVVKTKIQRSYNVKLTILPTFKKTVADGGLAALFVGGPQRVMIIAPLFGITLMSYEIQKWVIMKYFGG